LADATLETAVFACVFRKTALLFFGRPHSFHCPGCQQATLSVLLHLLLLLLLLLLPKARFVLRQALHCN